MNRRYLPAALALCATLLAGSSLLQAKDTEHDSAKTDAAADEKDKDKESPRHLADESKVTQNSYHRSGPESQLPGRGRSPGRSPERPARR